MRVEHLGKLKLEELKSVKKGLEARLKMNASPEETIRLREQLESLNRQIQAVEGQSSSEYQEHDKLTEETLKPINKVNSRLDKELQEWEVESTKEGQDSQGNG
jgi:Ni,Fe-hydrogenase maturation factor